MKSVGSATPSRARASFNAVGISPCRAHGAICLALGSDDDDRILAHPLAMIGPDGMPALGLQGEGVYLHARQVPQRTR